MVESTLLNVKLLPYIGTKLINATPLTRGQYNNHRGWNPPSVSDTLGEDWYILN